MSNTAWCPDCHTYHLPPLGEKTDAGELTKPCMRLLVADFAAQFYGDRAAFPDQDEFIGAAREHLGTSYPGLDEAFVERFEIALDKELSVGL